MPIVDDLERLAGLYRDGAISDGEFAAAKRQLFAGSEAQPTRGDATAPQPDGYAPDFADPTPVYRPAAYGCRPAKLAATERVNNTPALTGFVLGLVSVVLYAVMLFPILAVVFSWRGLATFDEPRQKNKWMAVVGLILGGVYCLLSLDAHGHLK